ncbi:MAG: hypothetical protein DHS20C17_35020 [Cyclobacteriaceae bacterium]|nr:MAG: hypothetical protein DHS20C17_35020 [Cyclobacteriaceae bacterium]
MDNVRENNKLFVELSQALSKDNLEFFNGVTSEAFFAVVLGTGDCIFVSKSAEQITGYSSAMLNPDFFTSIIHYHDKARVLRYYTRCVKGIISNLPQNQLKSIDLRIKHNQGHWIWITLRGVVVPKSAILPKEVFFGGIHDITKRKLEEISLKKALHSEAVSGNPDAGSSIDNPVNTRNFMTPREKEVLELIGKGYSSREIARMLFLSPHTVIKHRKNLLAKFKVKNTAQLICQASKSDWLN